MSSDRPAGVRAAEHGRLQDALTRYRAVRSASVALTRSLTPEDMAAQSMPDASPTKWHLAHTSWFFETFLLVPNLAGYKVFDPKFGYLFNSYYEAVGARQPRPQRGLLTRPSVADVLAYRDHVDAGMARLLANGAGPHADLLELGLAHEEQHQELILMDILHLFAASPLQPAFAPPRTLPPGAMPGPLPYVSFDGGLVEIGSGWSPTGWPSGSSPTRNGSPSWPTAATRGPSCGSPKAGPRSRPRAGARRASGRRRTGPGWR
jgi:hypothetical protein